VSGVAGKSAVDLARDLLQTFGGLNGIFSADLTQISTLHGMGESKYRQLQAIYEMSQRALAEQMKLVDVLCSPQKVRDYLCLKLGALSREVFLVIFLDTQNRVITQEVLFEGTLMQTSVYPREVLKRVLHYNAAAVIFAHNHLQGATLQSRADELMTQELKNALALVDVEVLDHFIVAGNKILSFSEKGLIKTIVNCSFLVII
jgi:DNA repair protein RadC